tara:strand:- start:6605 stop:6763 length:159 start_codon:yes stop_codon:yes gene_type:complete
MQKPDRNSRDYFPAFLQQSSASAMAAGFDKKISGLAQRLLYLLCNFFKLPPE